MIDLLAALLTLAVVVYGLLLIVTGEPRLGNKLPRVTGRAMLHLVHGLLRLLRSLLTHIIQFIFYRPRR